MSVSQRLAAFATFGLRHPRIAVSLVAVLVTASLLIAALGPLGITTSRRGLVSPEDNAGQARMAEFVERFGRTDALVFAISGGEAPARRAVSRVLSASLAKDPEFAGRILNRVAPPLVAEIIGLHEPQLLHGLTLMTQKAGGRVGLADLMGALTARIEAALDGKDAPGAADTAGLDDLAPVIDAFNAVLKGDRPERHLARLTSGRPQTASAQNVDDEGFVTGASGKHHLLVLFPELPSDEGSDLQALTAKLRAARDAALREVGDPAVTADLTGLPAISADELDVVSAGVRNSGILTTAGIFLLMLFAFRSWRFGIIALVPLGGGVIAVAGIIELLYDDLNLITSNFLPLLMGLGIDLGVHLLYRYGEHRRDDHANVREATRGAILHAGPGIIVGVVSTALAFMTTATSDFTAYAELGMIAALGLLLMLVVAFALFPSLVKLGGRDDDKVFPPFPGLAALGRAVGAHPRILVGGAVALSVAAAVLAIPNGPGWNTRWIDMMPSEAESYRAFRLLEADGEMGPEIVNITAGSIEEARVLTARLRAQPSVGSVYSPSDLLPELDAARIAALRVNLAALGPTAPADLITPETPTPLPRLAAAALALRDAFEELAFALDEADRDRSAADRVVKSLGHLRQTLLEGPPGAVGAVASAEADLVDVARRALVTAQNVVARGAYEVGDLPPIFRDRYVSTDGDHLAIYARPAGDVWDPAVGTRFAGELRAVAPDAAGLALEIHEEQALIREAFYRAAMYAAVLVFALLLLALRSVGAALLAMSPVCLGLLWMFGVMRGFDLDFNVANIVALPLIIGIGVDAGAHLMHRYREARDEGRRPRLEELIGGTGAAVTISSLTTMIGFGALMVSDYGGMKSLGATLVCGIGFTLIISVVVLPAILVVTGRVQPATRKAG